MSNTHELEQHIENIKARIASNPGGVHQVHSFTLMLRQKQMELVTTHMANGTFDPAAILERMGK